MRRAGGRPSGRRATWATIAVALLAAALAAGTGRAADARSHGAGALYVPAAR